jgi:hypothetical protein
MKFFQIRPASPKSQIDLAGKYQSKGMPSYRDLVLSTGGGVFLERQKAVFSGFN